MHQISPAAIYISKFSRGQVPGPLLGAGKGREVMGKIKGFLPLREGKEGKDRGGTRGVGGEKEGREG